jgi:ribonuclease-3
MAEGLPTLPGYSFADPGLLETALTHRSSGSPNNERLEFLGDAVVGLAVAELLLDASPDTRQEGPLTQARAQVVSRPGLADAARRLDLGPYLRLGISEEQGGGAEKDRILCGAFEALVGAVFLDGGYGPARTFCAEILGEAVESAARRGSNKDPKNILQELAQASSAGLPDYQVVQTEGEDHCPLFEVRVQVGCISATGVAGNKKAAEREAARAALETARRHPELLRGPATDEAS